MTLIVGMYYDNRKGTLIASDSRIVQGYDILPLIQKVFKIENSIFAFAGIVYLRDELIEEFKKRLKEGDIKEKIQEIYTEKRDKYTLGDNSLLKKKNFTCQTMFSFYKDNNPCLANVDNKGLVEPFYQGFTATGQNDYANIILKGIYQEEISKKQAIIASIYVINETAKINGGVDDNIQIGITEKETSHILNYDKKGNFIFQKPEFEEIKNKLVGVSSLHANVLKMLLNGNGEDRNKLEKLLVEN